MVANETSLTRSTIFAALTRLGALAQATGSSLTLVVVGGAALVLHYNNREATQDVDVYIDTPPERRATRAWAATVAHEQGLPEDWLNDGATGFMQGITFGPLLLDAPGIRVFQASGEQLLAMKLSAWRGEQDANDAAVVLRDLAASYPDKAALWAAIAPYVVTIRAQYAYEELWGDLYE